MSQPSPEARAGAAPSAVASAGPKVKNEQAAAHAAVAVKDERQAKAESIVLPTAWIYGHVPREAYTLPALSVAPAVENRYYGRDPAHSGLGGLRLSDPETEGQPFAFMPPREIAPRSLSSAAPAPRLGWGNRVAPPLPFQFDEDPKLPEPVAGDVLRSNQGAFDACYATATHLKRGVHGEVDVDFLIGKDGRVADREAHASGPTGSRLPSCLSNSVSKLEFAPPAEPVKVRVHFNLRPPHRSSGA